MAEAQYHQFGLARMLRTISLVTGIVSLIAGIVILIWPFKSALAITVIIAVYALVAGVVNVALAVSSKGLGGWLRVGIALVGVLFIVSAFVAFANLASTTVLLAAFVAVMLGVSWVVDGVVSLFSLGAPQRSSVPGSRSKGWTIAFAIISILAGAVVLLSPLLTAVWLWLFIGVSLVVFGVVQIVRAATLES